MMESGENPDFSKIDNGASKLQEERGGWCRYWRIGRWNVCFAYG